MKPYILFVLLQTVISFKSVFLKKYLQWRDVHSERRIIHGEIKLSNNQIQDQIEKEQKRFPFSKTYYENYIKRLNSRNSSIRDASMLGDEYKNLYDEFDGDVNITDKKMNQGVRKSRRHPLAGIQIIIGNGDSMNADEFPNIPLNDDDDCDDNSFEEFKRRGNKKSSNFEVFTKFPTRFKHVGGYENVKEELMQCVDILKNFSKYEKYNIRVPRGLILEGPPGNGKTLLAKAFAGEANVGFIPVSGSQFQEKYVGVGSNRVRELFELAKKNKPCIIFIDEIDAIGRKRSADGESSSSERDNTLNELLVQLDGFQNISGVFIMGATNRMDLLDQALIRPGRIDKQIFIGLPDRTTRKKVLEIHIHGKPYNKETVHIENIVDMTEGLSCAQIENLLNEAMLNTLRRNHHEINITDLEYVINKMMVGWQPNEHVISVQDLDRITIHEMGHVAMGLISNNHAKVKKVMINLYSPKSPGYTIFDKSDTPIYTRETLFEHLMILLSGRIAEEICFGVSVTTGAINDFEEALKLAEKMVIYYGMGKHIIYPRNSEKYKKQIDDEIIHIINDAYMYANFALRKMESFIRESANLLKTERILSISQIEELISSNPDTKETVDLLKYCSSKNNYDNSTSMNISKQNDSKNKHDDCTSNDCIC